MNFKTLWFSLFICFFCFFLPSFLQGDDHTGDAHSEKVGDLFVKLPMLMVPVVQERQLKAVYSLRLIIELNSFDTVERAQLLSPRLIDKILTDLYGLFALIWHPDLHIRLIDIKKRLHRVCEGVLGQQSIRSVLIQDFNRQLFTQSD
jgi:hypothetical protein